VTQVSISFSLTRMSTAHADAWERSKGELGVNPIAWIRPIASVRFSTARSDFRIRLGMLFMLMSFPFRGFVV